jgi:hypothetical protein
MDEMIEALQNVVAAEPEPEIPQVVDQPEADQPEAEPEPAIIEDADAGEKSRLTEEIIGLWSQHLELSGTRKATARELRLIRNRLAERLYQVKTLLARPGRGGEWRGWLRERAIPRSTADRLVSRHAETLGNENGNVLSGAINENENAVEPLVQSLLPRLKRTLPDIPSVFKFIAAVGGAFGLSAETTEDCLLLSQPKTVQSEDSPSATGAPEAESAQVQSPGTENSSDEIAVQAETTETNGRGE